MPRWNKKTPIVPHRRVSKAKPCKGCGKPIRRSIQSLGYCKSCFRLAQQQSYKEYVNKNANS